MSTLKKKLNKKGFTLAELLIVVAIIAILVAVSVPIFTGKLEEAKKSTDAANLRAAKIAGGALLLSADENKVADDEQYYNIETGKLQLDTTGLTGYNKTKQGTGGALAAGTAVIRVDFTAPTAATEAEVEVTWVALQTP